MDIGAFGVAVALVLSARCVAAGAVLVSMGTLCRWLYRGTRFVVRRMFTFRSVSVESCLVQK